MTSDKLLEGVCGENQSILPADMVGCGKSFASPREVYRCTHCDVPFHKECAEKHFQSDNVLTEEMIDEILRREAQARSQEGSSNER
jgi:hypothetical protein